MKLVISPQAAGDIEVATRWWLANRPAAPGLLEQELLNALELIAATPQAGAPLLAKGLATKSGRSSRWASWCTFSTASLSPGQKAFQRLLLVLKPVDGLRLLPLLVDGEDDAAVEQLLVQLRGGGGRAEWGPLRGTRG